MLKNKKLMLRNMNTDLEGKTECIEHRYEKKVYNLDVGGRWEDICIDCGKVKPLDPKDNNTVEVD